MFHTPQCQVRRSPADIAEPARTRSGSIPLGQAKLNMNPDRKEPESSCSLVFDARAEVLGDRNISHAWSKLRFPNCSLSHDMTSLNVEPDSEGHGGEEGTLKTVLDAFNRHDLDNIMSFFTEDCSFDMPKGPNSFGLRYRGKSAVREGLASRFSGIPDVHYRDDRHFVSKSGDRGVSEWLLTGTTVSGDKIEVRGCDLFEFSGDGKIKRKDSYWKIVQPKI